MTLFDKVWWWIRLVILVLSATMVALGLRYDNPPPPFDLQDGMFAFLVMVALVCIMGFGAHWIGEEYHKTSTVW